MKRLNQPHLQDPARLTSQAYVSRVHNRRASSAFIPAPGHRRASSNRVLDVAYGLVEILGDHVLTTGRGVCYLYLVSCKSGMVTFVSRNLIQRLRHVSSVTSLLTFFSPQIREIELSNRWMLMWAPTLVDTEGSSILLPNYTKNSLELCKSELASSLSGATTHVYCVFPRITGARARRLRCRV
jgi:hypothetical protein